MTTKARTDLSTIMFPPANGRRKKLVIFHHI
jgi:hypothetical protein